MSLAGRFSLGATLLVWATLCSLPCRGQPALAVLQGPSNEPYTQSADVQSDSVVVGSTPNWGVTFQAVSLDSWLTFNTDCNNPSGAIPTVVGVTPASLFLCIDPSKVADNGYHVGLIEVTAADYPVLRISIRLTKFPTGNLSASPDAANLNGASLSATITVSADPTGQNNNNGGFSELDFASALGRPSPVEGNWLTFVQKNSKTPGKVDVTVDPTKLQPALAGTYTNTLVFKDTTYGDVKTATISLTVRPQDFGPVFSGAGFLNAATSTPGVAPAAGGLASLYGDFRVTEANAPAIPLPGQLSGLEVTFHGGAGSAGFAFVAPLLFVSPGQVNLQVPWEVDVSSGHVLASVKAGGLESDLVDLQVARYSPGVFTLESGPGHAVALNVDWTFAQPPGFHPLLSSHAVPRGEPLIIYATGLGPTTPPGETGNWSYDSSGNWVRRDTVVVPNVLVGGVSAQVLFSGLSPQFVGVYQVNITVPQDAPTGDSVPLVLEVEGLRSRDDVTIAVATP